MLSQWTSLVAKTTMLLEAGTPPLDRDFVDDLPGQREPQDNRIAQPADAGEGAWGLEVSLR